nr:unknown [Picea sitchensis]
MREQALIRLEHETHHLISQKRKQEDFDFREKQSDAKFRSHENKSDEILDVKEIKYSQDKRRTHSSRRRHKLPHPSKDKCS